MTPLTKTTREQEWQWQSHKQGEGKCWCVHVLCIHTHTLFLSLYVFVWSGHVRIYMNENKQKQGNNIHVLYTHGAPSSVLTSSRSLLGSIQQLRIEVVDAVALAHSPKLCHHVAHFFNCLHLLFQKVALYEVSHLRIAAPSANLWTVNSFSFTSFSIDSV